MSEIRVTYSGLISFVVGIITIFTGLISTLIITRTLTTQEYGTWTLIGGLFVYLVVLEPIISYWTTREIARGVESGRTAIISSGIFSIGGILGYILISNLVGSQTDVNKEILFFASILIPVIFLNKTLSAINLGWKPQVLGYGTLAYGVSQILTVLFLVYFFNMGVNGVILSALVSNAINILILFIYGRRKLLGKFKKEILKKWLKIFWLPIYPGIMSMVLILDVILFSIITGSVEGLAFWAASMAIVTIIPQASLISRAVYPKLLSEINRDYIKNNLTHFFYFAIPLTGIAITFSKPILFALNPIYIIAVPIVLFGSIYSFLNTLSLVFHSFLLGIENVDINKNSSFKNYIKSKLFFLPTIQLIQSVIFIVALTSGLLILKQFVESQLDLVIFWAIIICIIQIPITIYYYILIKRNFTLSIDYKPILKYLITGIFVFGILYLFLEEFLKYNENIFIFIPSLFPFMTGALVSYLFVTYFIDSKTRQLVNITLKEIKKSF